VTGHERWALEVGAYLLGALPEPEREAFEEHLADCPHCRRDVEHLGVAADALPVSVPPVDPPLALKRRLMTVVEAEAELVAAAERRGAPAPAPRAPFRLRRRWSLPPAVALAAACALLALGIAGGLLAGRDDGTRTVVAQVTQPGAQARLEIDEDGGRLVARGFEPAPDGRIYQVWKQRGSAAPEPTDALWTPRADGSATVGVPGSLEGVDRVLVSAERMGGADAPSTDPVLVATLN
jgi:anti-sigma-K factor RskA